ncbi:MAG: hypothetical protein ABII75_02305 [Candidatus Omnitrophota bacterium]
MKIYDHFKKTISWLFEEVKDSDNEEKLQNDHIELNMRQAGLLFAITIIFLIMLLPPPSLDSIISKFKQEKISIEEMLDAAIEKNYFSEREDIENGDFNDGLKYWNTADGGELFPESKSNITVNEKEFHSLPNSVQIECIKPASRLFYTKYNKKVTIDNPYDYKNKYTWLGVLPGSKVNLSLWHKGGNVYIYLQCLKRNGEWTNLSSSICSKTNIWKQKMLTITIPRDGRAIMLELTLNQEKDKSPPVVLIDDVSIRVE